MQFVDETTIWVKAGDGGNGCVSFHRESQMDRMGPDGGDGGRGGDVIFEAVEGLDTLLDFALKRKHKAPNGQQGMGSNCSGKSGKPMVLKVPTGTMIFDETTGVLLKDLHTTGMVARLCRGGRGGWGNQHFATSTRQAPRFAIPGGKGQERHLRLELKLIADVGLVGLPNAGKSTLLSVMSAARPKIADYPFTTLSPQPGIVSLSGYRRFVMADIPGLIEGAHEGRGLGDQFLRHIERTRVILHLIDISPPEGWPADHYYTIRQELEKYSSVLAAKPELIALTKMDLDPDGDLFHTVAQDLRERFGVSDVLAISSATGRGLDILREKLWTMVDAARVQDRPPSMKEDVSGPGPAPHLRDPRDPWRMRRDAATADTAALTPSRFDRPTVVVDDALEGLLSPEQAEMILRRSGNHGSLVEDDTDEQETNPLVEDDSAILDDLAEAIDARSASPNADGPDQPG